jgi:hypothetical protein
LDSHDSFKHGSGELQFHIRCQVGAQRDQIKEHFVEALSQELLGISVEDVPVLPEKFSKYFL